ncbi:MAG: crosslink repair DNA glycosylase YcaQ family protein [Rhizobiaceae bacterium]
MSIALTNKQARRLILLLQGLTLPPHKALGQQGLSELILQLGFVQLDSIQWVERAQHMILFARSQAYRPAHLKRLLEKERFLFENWTHDAAVIPCCYYPYWRHKFARHKARLESKFSNWQGGGYIHQCDDLLTRIEDHGALRSRDLDRPQRDGPAEMWQWHDGKAALEYLWRIGHLCIHGREGFQKVYDLAERGIPVQHFEQSVSHDEFVDWACRSALQRLGFGSPGDVARFWDLVSIAEAKDWLEDQSNDCLSLVEVQGIQKDNKPFYGRPDLAQLVENLPDLPGRVRALSPFDPVIRDRKRLEWLFGFEYRIEIYVPEEKRRWGYYVFPLLEGDRLIGRIDMRARRKEGVLEIKSLWLEPGVKLSAARQSRIDAELVRQARLGGVKSVVWLEDALKA